MKKMILGLTAILAPVSGVFAAELTAGQAVTGLSASTGETLSYEISVPSNASNLGISIAGGQGDADLYVAEGVVPSNGQFDCRPYLWGNDESCYFADPNEVTYFINVTAYNAFSGLTLLADYELDGGTGADAELENGETVAGLQGNQGTQLSYQVAVPAGASNLVVSTSGGSGDVDLYVKAGGVPSLSDYDCRPYEYGNDETCSFETPAEDVYHIMLRGYSAFNDVGLSVQYQVVNNDGATWDGFSSYYANAIGLSGTALVTALEEASARHHDRMTYSQVWYALMYTDEDPNNTNNVILIYTGRSQAKSYNASGNNDPDAWNREHTWPKSHGFPSSGDWGYTDIHQLRPCDASVNSARGNKDYDNGGNMISEAPGNFSDSDSFEPRDEVKGDLARMMFYMDVRYNGNDNTGTDDLTLVNYTGTSGANLGRLCTLLEWHQNDPVDQAEIDRHGRIVERQGNRNPFVDYPAWVEEVWGSSCN